jgi:hypothetical protein
MARSKRDGRFLAGLAAERLAVSPAVGDHGIRSASTVSANCTSAGFSGKESAVPLDAGNAREFREVGALLHARDALGAIPGGHQADGGRALHENRRPRGPGR